MSITSVSPAVYHLPAHKPGYVRIPMEELPPERRAEIEARRAQSFAHRVDVLEKFAEMDAQRAALGKGPENHVIVAPNVSGLSREQAEQQIYFMGELIQSGQSEDMALSTGNGDKTTNNYRQYVYWLQQHVKELEGAGQSAPTQAGEGQSLPPPSIAVAGTPAVTDQSIGWKRITESVKYEDLSPEQKARWALDDARVAEADRIAAEMAERAKLETVESNVRYAPNVSTLDRQQALKQIERMRDLIQSGEADKNPLQTGYGDKTTNNYRQYVYWLQQHVKELEGAGQTTLAQA